MLFLDLVIYIYIYIIQKLERNLDIIKIREVYMRSLFAQSLLYDTFENVKLFNMLCSIFIIDWIYEK